MSVSFDGNVCSIKITAADEEMLTTNVVSVLNAVGMNVPTTIKSWNQLNIFSLVIDSNNLSISTRKDLSQIELLIENLLVDIKCPRNKQEYSLSISVNINTPEYENITKALFSDAWIARSTSSDTDKDLFKRQLKISEDIPFSAHTPNWLKDKIDNSILDSHFYDQLASIGYTKKTLLGLGEVLVTDNDLIPEKYRIIIRHPLNKKGRFNQYYSYVNNVEPVWLHKPYTKLEILSTVLGYK